MPDPGPYDGLLAALENDFAAPVALGLAAVALIGITVAVVKWGIPQLLGFFKRIAR